MMKWFCTLALGGLLALFGQEPPAAEADASAKELDFAKQDPEAAAWRKLASAGTTSPTDYARDLEDFLRQFPDTARRPDIERSLAQAAMEERDRERILRYGEPVLEREPQNLQLVEFVTRALLDNDDPGNAKKALRYTLHLENSLRMLALRQPDGPKRVETKIAVDEGISRALVFRSRALGNLGRLEEAVEMARASYATVPSAEAAREAGRWLARQGKDEEAIAAYADALAINEPDVDVELRAGDRKKLRELYLKTHDSEAGLGDLVLEAFDRTSALLDARHAELLAIDPNLEAGSALEFQLSALEGEPLDMETLRGKVVILNFWATWCQPCRVQEPLFVEVRKKFADRSDVVFLNVNTDNDRKIVGPFLDKIGWDKHVYFEDGLQMFLKVRNIPTTIILDKKGATAGRIIGFHPDLFKGMLADRIERTLAAD